MEMNSNRLPRIICETRTICEQRKEKPSKAWIQRIIKIGTKRDKSIMEMNKITAEKKT